MACELGTKMSANKCSCSKRSKQQIKLDMYKNRLHEDKNEDDTAEEQKSLLEKFETEVSEKSQKLENEGTGVENVESLQNDDHNVVHENEIKEENTNIVVADNVLDKIENPNKNSQENKIVLVYKLTFWMFLITIPIATSYLVFNINRIKKMEDQIQVNQQKVMKLGDQNQINYRDAIFELKYQMQMEREKNKELVNNVHISEERIIKLEDQSKVDENRIIKLENLIEKLISQLPKGCSCNAYVRADGFGNCQKTHPNAFQGNPFCYVDLPSDCSDLQLSEIEATMGASAVACGEKTTKLTKYSAKLKNLVKRISPFKLFQ